MMSGDGHHNGKRKKNSSRSNQNCPTSPATSSSDSDGMSSTEVLSGKNPGTKTGANKERFEVIDKVSTSLIAEYRDFSRDRPDISTNRSALGREGAAQTFPMKLHSILSNPEFSDIISWLPHGRAWRILQTKAFEERAIPLYFRHGRYSSFARQVNGWGFRRITHGPDYNSYYHEMFLKGLPHLCDKMKRLTSKDVKKLQKDDAVLPDFYALSRDFPLPDAPGDPLPATPAPLPAMARTTERVVADTIRSINAPLLNPPDTSNQNHSDSLGSIAGLLSSFGAAPQLQQSGQDSQASMLGTFAAINQLSSQAIANGTGSEPATLETRRKEILQRMLQIAGTSSTGSAPQFATNQPTTDLNSQLMSLINAGANRHEALPFASHPMYVGTNFQTGSSLPAVAMMNSYGQQTSTIPSMASNTLSADMLALLGQQVLNPAIAASLAQMVSNPASRMTNSVNIPPPTFAIPVAPPSAVILGPGSAGIDLSSLLQQKSQSASNSSVPSTESNNVGAGNFDLASLIRMSQSSNISNRSRAQIPLNGALQTNPIHLIASAIPGATGSESPRNNPTPQSIDLSHLLRIQQPQQSLNSPIGTLSNSESNNVGLDLNALALLLDPNNANNLRHQIQASTSSGQQQLAVVQPSIWNQLGTLVGGNNSVPRSQYQNTRTESSSNPNDASSRGIEIQYLQQLLGQQTAPSNIASNTSQLEAALKLLISNVGQGSTNNSGNGSDTNINNLLAGLQR